MAALLIIFLCVFLRNSQVVVTLHQDVSTEEKFKDLDKTPVIKTIKLKGGDIVDCVDFHKQPAFDNPLLKDHNIQILPKSYTERRKKELAKRPKDEVCPFGSVPIPRAKLKHDNFFIPPTLNHTTFSSSNRRPHQIFINMERLQDVRYRGANGVVSIYNVSVGAGHLTFSNIWIETGPHFLLVGIIIGLTDYNPRLFTFWSTDGGQKVNCYNFFCKGFVQVDSEIAPGHLLMPVSTYGGITYDLPIRIFQDKTTGNWILSIYEEGIVVGYFPKELLPNLEDGAIEVAWGGQSVIGKDWFSPPMGSGHKPDCQYNHAAYFKNLVYFDENYNRHEASEDNTGYHTDGTDCFGFQLGPNHGPSFGYNFFFGGPGGYCG